MRLDFAGGMPVGVPGAGGQMHGKVTQALLGATKPSSASV